MAKDGLHVLWLRNKTMHPVACVASKLEEGGIVRFSVATWNAKLDKFNRSTGLNKAKGCILAKPEWDNKHNPPRRNWRTLPLPKGVTPRTFVLTHIASTNEYGSRAAQGAKLLLKADAAKAKEEAHAHGNANNA